MSVASRKIRLLVAIWVPMIRRRLSNRSAKTPPKRLKNMAGMALAAPTSPSDKIDPVISYVSQNWATRNIWNPLTDASSPNQ